MSDFTKLNEVFGTEEPDVPEFCESDVPDHAERAVPDTIDTEYAKQKLALAAELAYEASKKVAALAEMNESPRAWEVFSTLLKTQIDAASDIASIEMKTLQQQAKVINNTQVNIEKEGAKTIAANLNDVLAELKKADLKVVDTNKE